MKMSSEEFLENFLSVLNTRLKMLKNMDDSDDIYYKRFTEGCISEVESSIRVINTWCPHIKEKPND